MGFMPIFTLKLTLFYNYKFKVYLILTFSQWKKGEGSGFMEYQGQARLQQRFETKLKRILYASRGTEWFPYEWKSMVFDEIKKLRNELTFKPLEYTAPRRSARNRR